MIIGAVGVAVVTAVVVLVALNYHKLPFVDQGKILGVLHRGRGVAHR